MFKIILFLLIPSISFAACETTHQCYLVANGKINYSIPFEGIKTDSEYRAKQCAYLFNGAIIKDKDSGYVVVHRFGQDTPEMVYICTNMETN